jgi:hypothetical protein
MPLLEAFADPIAPVIVGKCVYITKDTQWAEFYSC